MLIIDMHKCIKLVSHIYFIHIYTDEDQIKTSRQNFFVQYVDMLVCIIVNFNTPIIK